MITDGVVLGLRADGSPIWLTCGAGGPWYGSTETAADEETDEDDLDDGDEGEEDDEGDGRPSADEWARYQSALRRNNAENKKLRLLRKRLTDAGVDPDSDEFAAALEQIPSRRSDTARPEPRKAAAAAERAAAKVEQKYKPVVAALALKAALADAGWSGKNPDRLTRLIDMDGVDLDADGNVTGITEQIDELKADFPEWFRGAKAADEPAAAAAPRKRGAAAVDGGERRTKPTGSGGWLERVDASLG